MKIGGYNIKISNRDKLLFPDAGITKADLAAYYRRAATFILRHSRGRPISMQRFPDGISAKGFYQKQVPDYFPAWIDTATVPIEGGRNRQVVIDKVATLIYLADQACITPHLWLSRGDRLREPDRMVFDLDPPGDDFAVVRDTALRIRELFDTMGIRSFAQITGSSGIHVVVALRRGSSFDDVRKTARDIARHMVSRYPDELTVEQYKSKRRGRLYLDTNRNAYGQTMVAPYAVRAREGAPVATPLEWDEVRSTKLGPRDYTIKNIFRRMSKKDDPWRQIGRSAVTLSRIHRELGKVTTS